MQCPVWLLLPLACNLHAALSQAVIGFDTSTARFIQANEGNVLELCVIVYSVSPGGMNLNSSIAVDVIYESRTALGKLAVAIIIANIAAKLYSREWDRGWHIKRDFWTHIKGASSSYREHFQTILEKIKVILTLGGSEP